MGSASLKPRRLLVVVVSIAAFVGSYAGQRALLHAGTPLSKEGCERVVSLSPGISETFFALGLGARLAGVTRFCEVPEAWDALPRLGGYQDPSYEGILSVNPDLVLLQEEHESAASHLNALGIPTRQFPTTTLEGLSTTFKGVGRLCGKAEAGQALANSLEHALAQARALTAGRPRPRVVVAVGRDVGSGRLGEVYLIGRDGYLDRLIAAAGGVNAYVGGTVRFPVVSAEGILRMDPDVIIDLVPDLAARDLDADEVRAEWDELRGVRAVRDGRVYVVSETFAVIPGPRTEQMLRRLVEILHPEVVRKGAP